MPDPARLRPRRSEWRSAWSAADLKRPVGFLTAVAAFVVSVPLSYNASCQIHEIGHALVGSVLGWSVEQIHLCLPAGGAVEYAATPGGAWVNTVESFAGGVIAAGFLALVYLLVFSRPRTPLRGPGWWAAGFGPALAIGPQLVVAVVEGTNPHRDYGAVLEANLALALAALTVTMAAGAAGHAWWWRSIWRGDRS